MSFTLPLVPLLLLLAADPRCQEGTRPINASAAKTKDIVTTAVEAGSFTTLAKALSRAGLVDVLKGEGPFTVFAPTDAAFARIDQKTLEWLLAPDNKEQLVAVLKHHVVAGQVGSDAVKKLATVTTLNGQRVDVQVKAGSVSIDDATVVKADIACCNGVIHVLDRVLLPSSKTVVETAIEAGKFKTLVAAVKAAGLVGTLSGKGPFTVFAPTDAAFAKLPKETLDALLAPGNKDQLVAVLTGHVVAGRVFSPAALAAGKATSIQGGSVQIVAKDGKVQVNDALLLVADLDASNGVIHVIDSVLLPPK